MRRILANQKIRSLYTAILLTTTGAGLLCMLLLYMKIGQLWLPGIAIWLAAALAGLGFLNRYFKEQDRQLNEAVRTIQSFLDGNTDARIGSDSEGELSVLFSSVNTLASVLSSKAQKEADGKVFLKDTISDISHQLKTPLAALNIYNVLLREEAAEGTQAAEFTNLSEKELDRIETLVQNLLKITKLDAGTLTLNKSEEDIAEMMREIELRFAYRAKSEHKTISLEGDEGVMYLCDREWLTEAIENLVKNALDHTEEGDTITISWKQYGTMIRIDVTDTGSGINQEDLPFIFNRFYRSRFSQDTTGVGLGLALTKAIVEEHGGVIEAKSELGRGSTFSVQLMK